MALRIPASGVLSHGNVTYLNSNNPFTWMVWFRKVLAANFVEDSFNTLKKGANCYMYSSSNAAPNGLATFDGAAGEARVAAANVLTQDFRHLACRHLAGTIQQFIVDGAAVTMAGTEEGYTNQTTNPLQWGDAISSYEIALFKFWSAALSNDEIAQERLSYRPVRTQDLLLWAPYDDGLSARDYSGSGFHGTITAGTFLQVEGPPVSYGG